MRIAIRIGSALLAMVVLASVIPGPYADVLKPAPANGAMLQTAQLPPAATEAIGRACRNCHSNETTWPWYAKVAPMSWMVRKDVSEARKFMNFSLWKDYGPEGQAPLLTLAADRVKNAEMPPSRYLMLHPEARLSEKERSELGAAFEAEVSRIKAAGH